jgi:hypothetical protein
MLPEAKMKTKSAVKPARRSRSPHMRRIIALGIVSAVASTLQERRGPFGLRPVILIKEW